MSGFAHNRGIERRYTSQLLRVAREVGKLAQRYADDVPALVRALKSYAARLEPWAAEVATRFLGEVDRANLRAWGEKSATIAKALKGDVAKGAVGLAAQERHFAQVTLITSLPLDAAARAQKLAEDAARGGKRAGDVRAAILDTEKVTASRAQLIARTEIAKANAALTEARAQMAGITHYIWRTMQDEDVRESHAALEGQIFAYNAPPDVDEGGAYNPGGVYNCFTGDTICRLDADMQRILRSRYCGTVREIHTAGSRYGAIIVTPNHPMKAAHGWRAAGELHAGDCLCAYEGGDGVTFDVLWRDYTRGQQWGEGELYGRRATVESRDIDAKKLEPMLRGREGTRGGEKQLYITGIIDRHFEGYVYTLATRKGWQRVAAGAIGENCRCFAEPLLTRPDAPLELIAPGQSIAERAAEVAAAVTRRQAAKASAAKAAATRAAKKAAQAVEPAAARAGKAAQKAAEKAAKAAATEAKALEKAAAKVAAQAERSAAATMAKRGTVSAYNVGKSGAQGAATAKETAMKTLTITKKDARGKVYNAIIPAIDYTDAAAVDAALKASLKEGWDYMSMVDAAKEAANKLLKARGLEVHETDGAIGTRINGIRWGQAIWAISGNTYAHKDALKAAGAKWSGVLRSWVFTSRADMLAFAKS